ncbi:LolA-related protein [Pseudomarimonas arenosa]|uniref:Outer membrane lipoprotein carrier protein LolA n=1 Tax=Pseudomarimonas arenosa TaxID=2774145 RepID=A0AAW3ZIQ0_9GAMM|nr:LolA-related protein [Pseudomarimonas arenosa]MBD8525409.1 hypothetical protein [Pseudomarimonas arenosa]
MISGKRKACRSRIALLLILLLSTSVTAQVAPELDALIAALAEPVPAETAFFERRESNLLAEPLLLKGALRRPAADVLIKQIDGPPSETMQIAADRVRVEREGQATRNFSLRRAPELAVLAASFDALLAGDQQRLAQHYQIHLTGPSEAWQIELLPRQARLAKRVRALRLQGSGSDWHCFDLELSNGEASRMWLGEVAAAAARAESEPARDALCQAHPAAQ